ncbi:hypothetical protein [Hylemonella gracilis]|uniref:hypothetical protein n=1 Tax=Hylemonella gracilis TaxID=80880 RepID=UPI0018CC0E4B|nr:hypothetical protein [Hylemonella gracilis]
MLVIRPRVSARKLALIAAGFAGLAILGFLTSETKILQRAQLKNASGKVTWVAELDREIRFKLAGFPETFSYPAKGKVRSTVRVALSAAENGQVSILFDPQAYRPRPWSSETKFHTVWEIVTHNGPARTLVESQEAMRTSNEIDYWISVFFAVIAAYSAYFSYLTWRKYDSQLFH